MSENSKIEWTDHTFNPWEGCQKVGPGCDHCYAENRNARFGGGTAVNWGPGAPRRRTSASNWNKPRKWNSEHAAFFAEHGRRQRVFCASLADVFDNAVDSAWRADLFDLIENTPNLDWLLLTKRIGNVQGMVPLPWISKPFQHGPDPKNIYPAGWPENVWLGATIVNREELLRDAPKLKAIDARVRFWSGEPLLSDMGWIPVELLPEWVIVGGESGPGARPMHPDWARSLRDQCAAAGVAFLFKQHGEFVSSVAAHHTPEPDVYMHADGRVGTEGEACADGGSWSGLWRVGKKAAGRLLDGVQHDGYPEAL